RTVRCGGGAERAQREQGPDAGQPLPSTPRLPAVTKPRTGTAAPAAAQTRQIRCGSALAADAARTRTLLRNRPFEDTS
ncbi:hypothetical protein ACN6LI_005762, partial [Streptomyces violaceoruber]